MGLGNLISGRKRVTEADDFRSCWTVHLAKSELPEMMGVANPYTNPSFIALCGGAGSFCSFIGSEIASALQLEKLALRHQVGVLQRSARKRPKLSAADRFFWAWLCRVWIDWRSALVIVKPETVIAWHRKGFQVVLDLEGSAGTTRTTSGPNRNPRADPQDESGESAVG